MWGYHWMDVDSAAGGGEEDAAARSGGRTGEDKNHVRSLRLDHQRYAKLPRVRASQGEIQLRAHHRILVRRRRAREERKEGTERYRCDDERREE